MSEVALVTAEQRDRRGARATRYITLHYLITNLGYFGVLSTLVVSLTSAGFRADRIALLVITFTITSKVAKIPLAPWLDRISAPSSVLLGCAVAGIGFVCLWLSSGFRLTAAALCVAGIGISINNLASKQLGAAASDLTGQRSRLFSMINIGVNLASAVAAPLALFFANRAEGGVVLVGVGCCYFLGGTLTYLNFASLKLDRHSSPVSSWRPYLELLRLRGMLPFLVINFFGWFLYGQLFNMLALYVTKTLDAAHLLGWLYTMNALLIVAAQLTVSRAAGRLSGGQATHTVLLGYLTWAVAFLVAFGVPGRTGVIAFTVVFTLAEMLFVPSVDVLLLGLIGTRNRAVGYSILSISTALGEASGGGSGVATYRWLAGHGTGREIWLFAVGLAVCAAASTFWLRGRITTDQGHQQPGGL
jgi:DHA1 family multidrug resistance protein-like MFS transporter